MCYKDRKYYKIARTFLSSGKQREGIIFCVSMEQAPISKYPIPWNPQIPVYKERQFILNMLLAVPKSERSPVWAKLLAFQTHPNWGGQAFIFLFSREDCHELYNTAVKKRKQAIQKQAKRVIPQTASRPSKKQKTLSPPPSSPSPPSS